MELSNNPSNRKLPSLQQQAFNEDDSFDFMLWAIRISRYWYLFVIAVGIALTLAYVKNRSWMPVYRVAANVIVETGGGGGSGMSSIFSGFSTERGYRNVSNQIIMFGSNYMIGKAIDKLPFKVSYSTRGRFKTTSLYQRSPIDVRIDSIAPHTYGHEINAVGLNDKSFRLTVGKESDNPFIIEGEYGKPVICPLFSVIVDKTNYFNKRYNIYFSFNTRDNLIAQYSGRLYFGFVGDRSTVVEVSTQGPVYAQDIDFINALCEEFLADNLGRKNEAASRTIDFINEQLGLISDSLSTSELNLRSFQASNLTSTSSELKSQLRESDNKRSELRLKSSYLTYLTNYLKGGIEEDKPIVPPTGMGIQNGALVQILNRLNELQSKRTEVGPKSPYYQKYTAQIESVRASLMETLRNMQVEFNIEKKAIDNEYARLQHDVANLPEKESKQLNLERKFNINNSYYTYLLQKRAESQIQKASNSSDNIILDKARAVSEVNGGAKKSVYVSYVSIALLVTLALLVLRELMNKTIRDVEDLKRISLFDILGVVRRAKVKEPVLVLKNPKSVFTESLRSIRTRIEFVVKRSNNISVMVTSTEPGDGKTYFSLNLAGIYAMTGKRVVMVDMDLRKPSVGSVLSMVKPKGMSNYLAEQADLDEIIIQNTGYKFDVILAGTLPPNPGELIRSEKLKEMLVELKKRYDYVIVDTCPIGLVSDAYSIATEVDCSLFVVRSEKTNRDFYKTISQQLKENDIKNLYVIFNDVDYEKAEYTRNYGYGKNSYYMRREGYYTDDYFTAEN